VVERGGGISNEPRRGPRYSPAADKKISSKNQNKNPAFHFIKEERDQTNERHNHISVENMLEILNGFN